MTQMDAHSIPRQRIVAVSANSGVRIDAEDSTGQKMLIMATLNKYRN
jgi:hypothetical protein